MTRKISFMFNAEVDDYGYWMYCWLKGECIPKQQYHKEVYDVGLLALEKQFKRE